MAAVDRTSGDGGVLTVGDLASVVPAFTGHPTWFGHPSWTPQLHLREARSAALFSGAMDARTTRRFIVSVGARVVVAPCGSSRSLPALLGAHAIVSVRRTGCATVIVLRK